MHNWLLIGHRGVGKSWLLEQLQKAFPQFYCTSLDREIEQAEECSIEELFRDKGEAHFRDLERKHLEHLLSHSKQKPLLIDVGAGFEGPLPSGARCLWVRRRAHSIDSVYLNRPALDGQLRLSPERYRQRSDRYQSWADCSVELREGPWAFAEGERVFFSALFMGDTSQGLRYATFTLQETTTAIEKKLLVDLGLKNFEHRDDLLSSPLLGPASDLLSLRKQKPEQNPSRTLWDWPLEWGQNNAAPILSLHTREDDLVKTLEKLPSTRGILKLAVPIHNFAELQKGHEWAQQQPEHRTFLPMSREGRWAWYRLWVASQSPLTFIRLADGSAPDQPSVLQWLNHPEGSKAFAAILGSPVAHSWTPSFHQNFFTKRRAPVLTIDVRESEWEQALPFLQRLGLRWAAVTSPLKKKAGELVRQKVANTLFFDGQTWQGTNTDPAGIRAFKKHGLQEPLAVWGGGGTLASVREVFPSASFYSSRTGECKQGQASHSPRSLLWAVGKEAFGKQGVFPPREWSLQGVFDMNYSSDSPGIHCAHELGCQYHSGLVMFTAQAKKQQEFWSECESQ